MARYIEIYEDIKQKIIDGSYGLNDKIPSKRVTADNYDVSIITIEHAYELLMEEGYIQARERSGYFVIYDDRPLNKALSLEKSIRKISEEKEETEKSEIDLSPEAFPFSIYSKTARRVMTDYGEEIMVRSPNFGCEILRKEISGYLARYRGIEANSDQIIIGSGSEYLYGLIVQALGRDHKYGIETPSYQKIAQVYKAEGVECEGLPLGRDGIESEALWQSEAEILHISPYRSYPSGVTATAAKKREYLRWTREKDRVIIEDDFESEFSPSRKAEETLFAIDDEDRVIYVNTFTKTIGSSMRMAYMVVPYLMLEKFRERIGFYTCTVPTFDQYIVAGLIKNGDFERHINRVRRAMRKKKQ